MGWDISVLISGSPPAHPSPGNIWQHELAWRRVYCHYCVCMWGLQADGAEHPTVHRAALPTPNKELFSLKCQQCRG